MRLTAKPYWELLVTYLRPRRFKVLLLAFLGLSNIGLQVVNPQFLGYFIDTALKQAPISILLLIGLTFLGLSILQQLLGVSEAYVSEDIGWAATNDLRADLTRHVLQLDTSFHNTHSPGELIERIDGDVGVLANFFSQFILRIFGNAVFILGVVVVLFFTDWRIGFALGGFSVVAIIALTLLRGLAVADWTRARQASADLYAFIEERLMGTEDIRANGGTSYVIYRLCSLMSKLLRQFRKARQRGNVSFITISSLFVIGEVIALVLGVYLYYQGAITIGTVFVLQYYTQLLIRPLNDFTTQLQDLQKATASIGRVIQLRSTQSRICDGLGVPFATGAPSVEFARVTFGYDPKQLVLQCVTFDLTPGQVVGLLGPTGSGKTSIVRLLLRLYDPRAGVIRMDGYDIRQARLTELRRRIGIVTQDVQLFRGTIRENLTLFNQQIDDAQLLDAFRQLGLWEWYERIPQGLDTMLDSNGGGLSAGEAQLLAFARVFLHNPGLIILDEASSRLDPITEGLIQKATQRLLSNRTGIVIAHHLATVMRADLILVIENGRVCEFGPRAELEQDPNSRFSNLLRLGRHEVIA